MTRKKRHYRMKTITIIFDNIVEPFMLDENEHCLLTKKEKNQKIHELLLKSGYLKPDQNNGKESKKGRKADQLKKKRKKIVNKIFQSILETPNDKSSNQIITNDYDIYLEDADDLFFLENDNDNIISNENHNTI